MQNTRKMSQFWPQNCFSRWKLWDTFRNSLSTKCATREKCYSLGRKLFFALEIYRHFSKVSVSRMPNTKKCHSLVWKIVFHVGNFQTFSKVFISEIQNAIKNVTVWIKKNDFRVGNFQPLFECFYQWNAKREKNVAVWIIVITAFPL